MKPTPAQRKALEYLETRHVTLRDWFMQFPDADLQGCINDEWAEVDIYHIQTVEITTSGREALKR